MRYATAFVVGVVLALLTRDVQREQRVRRFRRELDTLTVDDFR